MSFLDGLKTIWSNPEIRSTAIKGTVIAMGVAAGVTYAGTKVATRKWRKESEDYQNEQARTKWIDGRPYVLDEESGNYIPKQYKNKKQK